MKLPLWFKKKGIYFPKPINIEQTSSEITARYKSELINGNTIVDLSGGFGVDCYFFSKRFKKVIHIEQNEYLSHIAKHNFECLGVKNIETLSGNSLDILSQSNYKLDLVYIDPSRRHDTKGKVFLFNDCLPNVVENLEWLFNISETILIKSSPLIDISSGVKELKYVNAVHIVSVKNEVKELLWILNKPPKDSFKITALNFKSTIETETFTFDFLSENQLNINYSSPSNYLYEPNTAILKSGGFKTLAKEFNVSKLSQNAHLYSSDDLKLNFPGRSFKIISVFNSLNKELKVFKNHKLNITTRDFPLSVGEIRKKYKIKEGGSQYLFFTTDLEKRKIGILCEKVKI